MPSLRHCNSILNKYRARESIKEWVFEVSELSYAEVVAFFFGRVMILPEY